MEGVIRGRTTAGKLRIVLPPDIRPHHRSDRQSEDISRLRCDADGTPRSTITERKTRSFFCQPSLRSRFCSGAGTLFRPDCHFFNYQPSLTTAHRNESSTSSLRSKEKVLLSSFSGYESIIKTGCLSIMSSGHQSVSIPKSTTTNKSNLQDSDRPSAARAR